MRKILLRYKSLMHIKKYKKVCIVAVFCIIAIVLTSCGGGGKSVKLEDGTEIEYSTSYGGADIKTIFESLNISSAPTVSVGDTITVMIEYFPDAVSITDYVLTERGDLLYPEDVSNKYNINIDNYTLKFNILPAATPDINDNNDTDTTAQQTRGFYVEYVFDDTVCNIVFVLNVKSGE